MRRALLLFCIIAGPSLSAQAPSVAGRVVDRTSGFPVAGVVVSGVDSAGTAIIRTVTDSASGFRLPVLDAMRKLQFRRIGYAPAEAALKDTANGRLDVAMTRLPTQLPPVRSVVTAQCDANANGDDVLALWDQARSGMLTSLVAHESKAAYTSVLVYQNGFKGDDETPRAVERIELPAGTSHPFAAGADPAQLAKNGYLVRDGLQSAFLAPDEGVLFDESFLATHCFTPEPGTAGDSLIGIRFETGKTSKQVEIKGVVWLRRDPLEIVSMEYTYTNIDRSIERARPGGSLRFRHMPNGITMIQEWRIRSASASAALMTVPGAVPSAMRGGGGSGRGRIQTRSQTITRPSFVTATETGAVIEMMQWTDAPPFLAPLGTLTGVLIDRQSGQPLANTPVRLFRTPFNTTTDSTGAFTMIDVLPGIYELDAFEPELDRYGAAPELVGSVAIKYGANEIKPRIDGPAAAVERGCNEKDGRVQMPKQFAGRTAVFGTIATGRGVAAEREFTVDVLPAGAVPGTAPFPLKGKTDKMGRFRVCGLPNGTATVSTRLGQLTATQTAQTDLLHPYRLLVLRLVDKPAGP